MSDLSWVCQTRDTTTWHTSETDANITAQLHGRCGYGDCPVGCVVIYPTRPEPPVRGHTYWNRNRTIEGEAA